MSPVTKRHPRGRRNSPEDVPHWLYRLLGPALHRTCSPSGSVTRIMTSSPSRGEEDRKKNSLHSFVIVFLKLLPNQSPAGINREHLRRGGGGGYSSVTAEHRREGKSLKMPRDKRITDQYSRMDFVILKRAVRVVHSHLLGAPRARPSVTPLLHPSLFFTATCLYLKR